MAIPFPDIDPYATLEVSVKASPAEVKKCYYKQCLKHHPDKQKDSNHEKFQKIQFSYAILSDVTRRKKYDETGSLEEVDLESDHGFSWKEFFDSAKSQEITPELIAQDREVYQNSADETRDIIEAMDFYDGDFMTLFEVIPHLEYSKEEEKRLYDKVSKLVQDGEVSDSAAWKKYTKNRSKEIRKNTKKMAKEAKEADKLAHEIGSRKDMQKALNGTENDLQVLIQRKNSQKSNAMDKVLGKYTRKSSKRKQSDLDDEEFERIQRDMLKKRKRS